MIFFNFYTCVKFEIKNALYIMSKLTKLTASVKQIAECRETLAKAKCKYNQGEIAIADYVKIADSNIDKIHKLETDMIAIVNTDQKNCENCESRECRFSFRDGSWNFENIRDMRWLALPDNNFAHPRDILKLYDGYVTRDFPNCYMSIMFTKNTPSNVFEYRRVRIQKQHGKKVTKYVMKHSDSEWLKTINNEVDFYVGYGLDTFLSVYNGVILKEYCDYIDIVFERPR